MHLLVDRQNTGASDNKPLRVEVTADILKLFPLTAKWKPIKGLKEETTCGGWDMDVSGWGRKDGDRHVLVLHNHCGDHHASWRMYIDGEFVYHMNGHFGLQMHSATDAMNRADAYLKSDKMRFLVKFDMTMAEILKQYAEARK